MSSFEKLNFVFQNLLRSKIIIPEFLNRIANVNPKKTILFCFLSFKQSSQIYSFGIAITLFLTIFSSFFSAFNNICRILEEIQIKGEIVGDSLKL